MRTFVFHLRCSWTLFSISGLILALVLSLSPTPAAEEPPAKVTPQEVLDGLKSFWEKPAREDRLFQPGLDPDYKGMSDSALSDMAPLTYAVTLHKTFGWKLPHEDKTRAILLAR